MKYNSFNETKVRDFMGKYDILIVGGSTTGCWFAERMAKEGCKVLVIEKNCPKMFRVRMISFIWAKAK